jgi:hypothetical protein
MTTELSAFSKFIIKLSLMVFDLCLLILRMLQVFLILNLATNACVTSQEIEIALIY